MEGKICECGYEVNGTSEKHLESNLKIHMKSKLHKKLMKAKRKKRLSEKQVNYNKEIKVQSKGCKE